MPEQTPKLLSHFSFFRFCDSHSSLSLSERKSFHQKLFQLLSACAPAVQVYQVYPMESEADILIWSSLPADDPKRVQAFFEQFACATLPYRQYLQSVRTLWGFTRPSQYTRSRSTQEIDPLAPERKPYLILYPFVKTAEWYLLSQETRQGIMNGHIKVGKQFPEITQLLLYSFGLQDQEFIVVYEADDLGQFSDLVNTLRSTEARRYTLRDTPLTTALYHPAEKTLEMWE